MKKIKSSQDKKMVEKYNPSEIEPYWQAKWEQEKIYQPDLDSARRPFYNLMMFPYPSAEGLHMGSVFTFTGVDTYGRFKRMQGYDVFEPFGLDGFGIHAENYALKIGVHPMKQAKITEANFYRQMRSTGIGIDWSRKVETYKEDYYKWTQWIFVQLFKRGLAYRKKAAVNFCPKDLTVLADEQVVKKVKSQISNLKTTTQISKLSEETIGVCERCESPVEKRELEQWFFRITNYADRLLANLEKLNWTNKIKIAQREWIGKKTGINITYQVNENFSITVFTTRPDTNFGATFIALAPDAPITQETLRRINDEKIKRKIKLYIEKSAKKSEIERQAKTRAKTGVFTGLYAINDFTGYKMPVWISDFVLSGFGTGAVVGVPGHDRRDFEFAQRFGLEIKRVVVGKDGDKSPIKNIDQVQEEEGIMINSGLLDGLGIRKATEKIMDYIEEKGYGKRETTYHLRDWLISRQRYWGPPIPMVYCTICVEKGLSWLTTEEAKDYEKSKIKNQKSKPQLKTKNSGGMAGWYPVSEDKLPVLLPDVEDWKPKGDGASPLANMKSFVETTCPNCGSRARRETDVSDNFLDSAWYFFRYISTEFDDMPFDKLRAKKWLPVHMYIGGAEHSVLHLLYSRFIAMVFKDLGLIDFEEPYSRFYAHGLIIKDGSKMSKSRGNVINPDEYLVKYGADTIRMYLRFVGPFDMGGDFRDSGIEGMHKFVKRVWTLFTKDQRSKIKDQNLNEDRLKMMHGAIKGVTEDLEGVRFNTAIAKLMTWYNFLVKQEAVSREEAEAYLKLLAPFAPYMAEELWQGISKPQLKSKNYKFESIHVQAWPTFNTKFLEEDSVTIAVQVNGKLRGTVKDPHFAEASRGRQKQIEELAKSDERVARFLEGKKVKKIIYVAGKVINFVVN